MVVKLGEVHITRLRRFESCVVLDGSQTFLDVIRGVNRFESCVVLDGSQTVASS